MSDFFTDADGNADLVFSVKDLDLDENKVIIISSAGGYFAYDRVACAMVKEIECGERENLLF